MEGGKACIASWCGVGKHPQAWIWHRGQVGCTDGTPGHSSHETCCVEGRWILQPQTAVPGSVETQITLKPSMSLAWGWGMHRP